MKTRIKDLYSAAINVQPVDFDWAEGYGEKWENYQPIECYNCGKIFAPWENPQGEQCPRCKTDCDPAEGPMMNYYYALPAFNPQDVGGEVKAAIKVYNAGSTCLVYLEDLDLWAIALTGGGMNLAWDICAAYIAVGYLPPLHYLDSLPNFAGMTLTAKNRRVLAAGRRACQVAKQWIKGTQSSLKDITTRLKANTDARKKAA